MLHRQHLFVFAYYLTLEALLLYLLFLPVFHFYERTSFYGSYLLLVFITTILFTMLTKYSKTYGPYLLMAPILFLCFYSFQFSLTMSIILSCVLVWRAIYLRQEALMRREKQYLIWILFLATLLLLLIDDLRVFLYVLLLFLVLIFGHLLRHLLFIEKDVRQHFKSRLTLWIVVAFFLGSVLIYFLFQPVRWLSNKIWFVFTQGIASLGGVLVYGLEFIELEFYGEEEIEQRQRDGAEEFSDFSQSTSWDGWKLIFQIALGLAGALLGAFLLWKIGQLLRRRFTLVEQEEVFSNKISQKMTPARAKRRSLFRRPKHPLRKVVYDFERKVAHTEAKRHEFETIEQWLHRLGFQEDLNLYQRLRYGQERVEEAEIVAFREKIKHLEAKVLNDVSK